MGSWRGWTTETDWRSLVDSDMDWRHLHLINGFAGYLGSAADALLRASLVSRDHVLGEVMVV
jgi:hypothetical protein